METFLLVWSRLLWEQATQSNDNDGKAIDQQKINCGFVENEQTPNTKHNCSVVLLAHSGVVVVNEKESMTRMRSPIIFFVRNESF